MNIQCTLPPETLLLHANLQQRGVILDNQHCLLSYFIFSLILWLILAVNWSPPNNSLWKTISLKDLTSLMVVTGTSLVCNVDGAYFWRCYRISTINFHLTCFHLWGTLPSGAQFCACTHAMPSTNQVMNNICSCKPNYKVLINIS